MYFMFQPNQQRRKQNKNMQSSIILNNDFDGRFSETVHPATGETDRSITSSRIRRQIHYLSKIIHLFMYCIAGNVTHSHITNITYVAVSSTV
jgi:hypothetical protein